MSAELSVSCVVPGGGKERTAWSPPGSVALQSLSMFFLGFLGKQTNTGKLACCGPVRSQQGTQLSVIGHIPGAAPPDGVSCHQRLTWLN